MYIYIYIYIWRIRYIYRVYNTFIECTLHVGSVRYVTADLVGGPTHLAPALGALRDSTSGTGMHTL